MRRNNELCDVSIGQSTRGKARRSINLESNLNKKDSHRQDITVSLTGTSLYIYAITKVKLNLRSCFDQKMELL